jgi:hypothetical protein
MIDNRATGSAEGSILSRASTRPGFPGRLRGPRPVALVLRLRRRRRRDGRRGQTRLAPNARRGAIGADSGGGPGPNKTESR